jgi:Transglycosylase SLT domain/Putative peptidoglycan binding domain
LLPAGANGPAFLVTRNFDAIYAYNAAESYALAIALLSDRLRGLGPIVTPWPTNDPGLSRAERRELQALLIQRGYDLDGKADGVIGRKSTAAIADFQARSGRKPDGRACLSVLTALRGH